MIQLAPALPVSLFQRSWGQPAGEPELVFAAGPGIRGLISGELSPGEAIDQEVIAVVEGDATCSTASSRHSISTSRSRLPCRTARGEKGDKVSTTPAAAGPHRPVHDAGRSRTGSRRTEEDTSGGFPFGGWQAPFRDEKVGAEIIAGISSSTLCSSAGGRTTSSPPTGRTTGGRRPPDRPEVQQRSEVRRLAREAPTIEWEERHSWGPTCSRPSTGCATGIARSMSSEASISGHVHRRPAVRRARAVGVCERAGRAQGLPDGVAPAALKLLAPAATGDSGAVSLRYAPAGTPTTGE